MRHFAAATRAPADERANLLPKRHDARMKGASRPRFKLKKQAGPPMNAE